LGESSRYLLYKGNNDLFEIDNGGEDPKRFVGVSPLKFLRVPGIPEGESVIQEEDSDIEGSATIQRANSGILFEDFDSQKSAKKVVNMMASSELTKSKQFGNLVQLLAEIRQQKSEDSIPGSRSLNLEGVDDSRCHASIDNEFE